jgi:hypothetical protein
VRFDSQSVLRDNELTSEKDFMPRAPRPRTKLPDSVHRQLNMYAIAAGAAGVGALALAQPVEAKIVYTPANVQIGGTVGKLNLDLNNDGITDFEFCVATNYRSCPAQPGRRTSAGKNPPSPFFSDLSIFPAKGANQVWGHSTFKGSPTASALPAGVPVGPKGEFSPGHRLMATWFYAGTTQHGGPWANVQHRYLGLKFFIKGKVHYGWARLNVHWYAPQVSGTLTGYAYETVPGKAIITGKTKGPYDGEPTATLNTPPREPATLGALALGAPGLSIWRREESVAAAPKSN